MSENLMTPEFRVSYPKVFQPEKNDLNGKMEYSVQALFPADADLSALKTAARKALDEKFGDKMNDPDFVAKLRNPFRDQSEKEKTDEKTGQKFMPDGYAKGSKFISAKSYQKPGLVDEGVQDIINEADFYGGCYARMTVQAAAYDQKGNRGVSFWVQNIQRTRHGDPFGGKTRPTDDFAPVDTGDAPAAAASGAASVFD